MYIKKKTVKVIIKKKHKNIKHKKKKKNPSDTKKPGTLREMENRGDEEKT